MMNFRLRNRFFSESCNRFSLKSVTKIRFIYGEKNSRTLLKFLILYGIFLKKAVTAVTRCFLSIEIAKCRHLFVTD